MNVHYLTTSRGNPQFYTFSQLFERTDNVDNIIELEAHWQERTREAGWLDFWQREGHELLEHLWHKKYPNYREEIDIATPEEHIAWQELWQQHACDQNDNFWHIFSCVFENYEQDLHTGLRGIEKTSVDVDEYLAELEINDKSSDGKESVVSDFEDLYNDSEKQQLKLYGLPTSFGAKTSTKKRKSDRPPIIESISENDIDNDMPKYREARYTKIPESIRGDSHMVKYWLKRFSLFSRFDKGILLDRESWFSVTPEKVAKQTARRLTCDLIVDAFCGCGGNAIQFANTCRRVIAIDIDAGKLAMAKHNATIYGVADKIEFIHADFFQFADSTLLRPDVVFLSPPWGGPHYQKQSSFDIEQSLMPLGATALMQHARRLTENVGLFLPRNSNIKQVIALAQVGQQCEVEHNYLDTRLVAITVYYGSSLIRNQKENDDS